MAHLTLKDVLHRLIDAADLSPADSAELHEAADIHDDPAAQAEKDKGNQAERDARVVALKAELADLQPEPVPAASAPIDDQPHGDDSNQPEGA